MSSSVQADLLRGAAMSAGVTSAALTPPSAISAMPLGAPYLLQALWQNTIGRVLECMLCKLLHVAIVNPLCCCLLCQCVNGPVANI